MEALLRMTDLFKELVLKIILSQGFSITVSHSMSVPICLFSYTVLCELRLIYRMVVLLGAK